MPTSTTKRPARRAKADGYERQEQGERTRQRIIGAAIELFAENGWRNTGIAALAERAGMTGPGLLYYFGSKERLLHEVMAERDRVDHIELRDVLHLRDFREQGRHKASNRLLTKLYAVLGAEALEPDQPLYGFFVERNTRDRGFVRRVLETEIAEGRARPDIDLDQLTLEIGSFTLGLEHLWLADPTIDIAAVSERYYDELTHRIAVPTRQEHHAD